MTQESISYSPLPFRDETGKFLPGQPYSGQRKLLEGTLRRAVVSDKANRLRKACERLLDIAANGEDERNVMAAFSIIADRLDGKAVARIETSGDDVRSLSLSDIVAAVLAGRRDSATDANMIESPALTLSETDKQG